MCESEWYRRWHVRLLDGSVMSETNSGLEADELRVVETLRIKIAEASNLPVRSNGTRVRDVLCSVFLDESELYRTGVSSNAQNPYFGDEFACTVPSDFRYLSFHVYGFRTSKLQKPIGKVTLRKEDIAKRSSGQDAWLRLKTAGSSKSEITGKVYVEITYEESIVGDSKLAQRLGVKVLDYGDMNVPTSKGSELYALAVLTNQGSATDRCSTTKKLRMKRRLTSNHQSLTNADNVYFDLNNEYDITRSLVREKQTYRVTDASVPAVISTPSTSATEKPVLKLTVWHDLMGTFSSYFHGEVRIPLDQLPSRCHKAWYCLKPRESSVSASDKPTASLGSLRVKIQYSVNHVLPGECYNPLKSLLLNSVNVQPVRCSAAYLLGVISNALEDAARPLVKLFLHSGQLTNFLYLLAADEMSKVQHESDLNGLFRGDSLVSKCIDELMRLVGLEYLNSVLKPCLDEIFADCKSCEIDPVKLASGENLSLNRLNLIVQAEKIFFAIINSAAHCPQIMSDVFAILRGVAAQFFPGNQTVEYVVVSSFIFLRFFAPAILNPKSFDIKRDNPGPIAARALTLISKTIQRVTNISVFGRLVSKEPYMQEIFENFNDERHRVATRRFLDLVSGIGKHPSANPKPSLVYREGVLHKRCRRRSIFHCEERRFLPRYFVLTDSELVYAKSKGKQAIKRIPVTDILGAERVPEETFQAKFVFRIAQSTKVVTVRANSSLEQQEWIGLLRKITVRTKRDLLHPGAFMCGQWTCCKEVSEDAAGCTVRAKRLSSLGLQMSNWDLDLELERIHVVFVNQFEKLRQMQQRCIQVAATELVSSGLGDSGQNGNCGSTRISMGYDLGPADCKIAHCTLQQMQLCAATLEEKSRTCLKQRLRKLQYGSIEAPIGDDNYLMLHARVKDYEKQNAYV